VFEKREKQIDWILFAVFEFARMNVDSQSHHPSKGMDRYRASADRRAKERNGDCRKVRERDLVVSIGVIKSIL